MNYGIMLLTRELRHTSHENLLTKVKIEFCISMSIAYALSLVDTIFYLASYRREGFTKITIENSSTGTLLQRKLLGPKTHGCLTGKY